MKKPARLLIGSEKADWMDDAACRDRWPIFDATYRDSLPPASQACRVTTDEAAALRICRTQCAVREQCLAWALAIDEKHGVVGGTTEWQRKQIRSRNQ